MSDSYRRKKEELEGANLADLHTLEEAERYLKDDLEVIDSGVPKMNIEEMWNTPEGMKWVNTSKIPFLNENGHITGVIGISMDITDRKQAEVKLESLNRELHTLNATKDKFFSIIAHDLKSPFNSIIGLSEILVDQVNDRDYKGIDKFAKIIYQSSNRAMDLLTNLMEWSQAQTGRLSFMPDRFALSPLVEDVVVAFEIICRQKEVSLQTKLDSDIHVFADRQMVSTILRNLLSNAVKFSLPGGNIQISTSRSADEVIVTVTDEGVGMPKEAMKKLFRIDESFSTPGTAKEKGTGLGLILCKEFVDKHGGKIWAASSEHDLDDGTKRGSVFSFTIPNASDE
jgi:signal transduction histidine kinase